MERQADRLNDTDTETASLTRRGLVQASAAGGALVTVARLGPLENLALAATAPHPSLRRSSYDGLRSSSFDVISGSASERLELIAVEDLPSADAVTELRGRDDAFAVRFRGETGGLGQGTWRLEHRGLGRFWLFLVPVGAGGGDQQYEAIVDRTVEIAGNATGPAPPATPQPSPTPAAKAPGLLGAKGKLTRKRRRAIVELTTDHLVEVVSAKLVRHGETVAKATRLPSGTELRLGFVSESRLRPGRYVVDAVLRRTGLPDLRVIKPLRLG